jgi:hypothetical protein
VPLLPRICNPERKNIASQRRSCLAGKLPLPEYARSAVLRTRQDTRRSRLCSSSDKLAPSQPLTNPRTNRQCRTTAGRGYKRQARSIEVQAEARPSRARSSSRRQYGPWQPDDHWAPHCRCDRIFIETSSSAQCVNRRRIGTPDRHPRGTPSFYVLND